MGKETYVAGCRASGKLHIGNYLGLVKDLVETQKRSDLQRFYFIADLHGLTTPFEPKEMGQNILDVAASYLAAGIDPDKTVFFLQSQVLEHTALAWIFNCITPLGELFRMTQFKEKERDLDKKITLGPSKNLDTGEEVLPSKTYTVKGIANAGLLTYPTLMAADILLYKPNSIPVGEDQVQHVELARIIARKFNRKFGQTFPEPKTYLRKPLRIMSLTDPTKKMSKTPHQSAKASGAGQAGDEGVLFLDDRPEVIHRKLKKAVTATVAGDKSPGEENLMQLLSHFGRKDEISNFGKQQTDGTLKYSELKEALAKDISDYFSDFREKKKALLAKPDYLKQMLVEGSSRARKVAGETLKEVKLKIGLL